MRIAHVITWLTTLGGGPPSVLASLARAQATAGLRVTVIAATQSPYPHVLYPSLEKQIVVRPGVTQHHLRWYNRAVAQEIREQIHGNDLVHIHGTWRYHLLAAAGAAKSYGIPYIISPHGNLDRYCFRHRQYLKWPYFMLFERQIMNNAAAIHCCSQMELQDISRLPIATHKFVVPNPVAEELFNSSPDHEALQSLVPQLRPHQNVISFLGRFHPIKRPEVLVAAFQRVATNHADWVLVLAGPHENPGLANHLAQDVQAAGLSDRIFFPGSIEAQAKAALLQRSQIYVQASAHENFCVSVAEAMRFGVPCVVSKEVALAHEIESNQAGLVCEGNPTAFADCLQRLMSNLEFGRQCGQRGIQVAEQFRPQEVQRRFTEEYAQCIGQRLQLTAN